MNDRRNDSELDSLVELFSSWLTMSFRTCPTSTVQGVLGHENQPEQLLNDQVLISPVVLHNSCYACVSTSSSHQGNFRHINLYPSGKQLRHLFSPIFQLRMSPHESPPG